MAEMEEKIFRVDTRVTDGDHGRHKKRRRTDPDTSTRGDLGSVSNPMEVDDAEASTANRSRSEEGGNSWWHVITDLRSICPGDQIYSYRGVVQHHGIVVWVPPPELAENLTEGELRLSVKVVHFDPSRDGVVTTPLEVFLEAELDAGCFPAAPAINPAGGTTLEILAWPQGGTPRRAFYSASGFASTIDCGATYACERDEPEKIVRRAKEAAKFDDGISGWSGYSLLTNNCETFACWCSTGRRNTLSRQATRALVGAGVMAGGVSAAAAASAGGFASFAGVTTATLIPRGIRRIHSTLKMVEMTVGVATMVVALADVTHSLRALVAKGAGILIPGGFVVDGPVDMEVERALSVQEASLAQGW